MHRAPSIGIVMAAALALAAAGCKDKSADVAGTTTTHGADLFLEPAPPPGAVETVEVEDDRAALVILGDGDQAHRPIVHLHGTCAVARADIEAWSSTARAYGSIVAIEGDTPCPDGIGGRTWHTDSAGLEKRIDAALDAIRTVRGVVLDREEITVVGDDIGALHALALAARAPKKFARLVLVGLPDAAPAYDLQGLHGIAVLASDREPQDKARRAYDAFVAEKIPAKMWTLPGATHSDYGLQGARTIGAALAFVSQK